MSVKGFKINNVTEKYDYTALDNLPEIEYGAMLPLDVSYIRPSSSTNNGVTLSYDSSDDSYNLTGTASANTVFYLLGNSNSTVPLGITPGEPIYVSFKTNNDPITVGYHIDSVVYRDGVIPTSYIGVLYRSGYLNIPSDTTGLIIRLYVASGSNVSGIKITNLRILKPTVSSNYLNNAASASPLEFVDSTNYFANQDGPNDLPDNCLFYSIGSRMQSILENYGFNYTLLYPNYTYSLIKVHGNSQSVNFFLSCVNCKDTYEGWCNHLSGNAHWRRIPDTKKIRVLYVGNSGSQDSAVYTPIVLEGLTKNLELDLGIAYKGSCSIEMHYDQFVNHPDEGYYEFDYWEHGSGSWSITGNSTTGVGALSLREILNRGPWDIILVQQGTWSSATWSTYAKLGSLMDNIMNYHKAVFGKAVKFGFNNSQTIRQDVTMEGQWICIDKVLRTTPCSFVIPVGTALRNARANATLDALGDDGHLTCDNGHLQEGLPVLLASYTTALKLLEVCGFGEIGIMGDLTTPTQELINQWHIPGQNGTCVETTGPLRALAQKCAEAAVKFPREIVQVSYLEDLPSEVVVTEV